jgi:hypothetical protein
MPLIRFRIRALMIVIAVSAVMTGLHRLAPPLFFALLFMVVVQGLLLVLVCSHPPSSCGVRPAYPKGDRGNSREATRRFARAEPVRSGEAERA